MKNSKNFILRIFLETKTTFSLFFTLHNFELSLALFGHFFNIHPVKSIQKSLNYRTSTDSIVSDRCRRARARVSIFDEFRNFFRGNFEKTEKFRNGKRRKFRYFIFFFGLRRGLKFDPLPKKTSLFSPSLWCGASPLEEKKRTMMKFRRKNGKKMRNSERASKGDIPWATHLRAKKKVTSRNLT